MPDKAVGIYKSRWVRQAEAAAAGALSGPDGVPNTPFDFGEELVVPLHALRDALARVSRAHHWAVFGPDAPASDDDLGRLLAAAGKGVRRLRNEPYGGKLVSGTFAVGLDLKANRERRAVAPRFAVPRASPLEASLHSCTCGYATLDGASAKRHDSACGGSVGVRRAALTTDASEGGDTVEARAYACTERECEASAAGKVWLSRQAATHHGKAHGCRVEGRPLRFYLVGPGGGDSKV